MLGTRKRLGPGLLAGLCVIATLAGAFSLAGCDLITDLGASNDAQAGPLDPEHVAVVAGSSNSLGFDLLAALSRAAPGENVILSPLSLSTLLAMLLEGSAGDTADAIAGVLHLDAAEASGEPGSGTADVSTVYGALLRYLTGLESGVDINVGNAIWPTTGYPLTDAFAQTMRNDFDAEVDELDLGSQQGADTIDQWVSDKTNGLIERMSDVLGLPDPSAVTVLMNTVYFKGSWTNQFETEATGPASFTLADGSQVEVPMMFRTGDYAVAGLSPEGDDAGPASGLGFTMVRLPYGEDQRFVMDALLPEAGIPIEDFIAGLSPEALENAAGALAEQSLLLGLPRFELDYKVDEQLDAALKALGMGIAYSPESDFTPMSPEDPYLSRVAHKTHIRVDEEGSEAAAASGAVMRESAIMGSEVRFDRPFVFTITDTDTGAILFLGLVMDPRA